LILAQFVGVGTFLDGNRTGRSDFGHGTAAAGR